MIAFEKALLDQKPDCVVVAGDVNATLSCSVIAKRLNIKVCHIEAGLRSGDMSMPEEVNRLVTDRISDLLLTPDKISSENLFREGTPPEKVKFVGNIMIDTLEDNKERASQLEIKEIIHANTLKDHPFHGKAPHDNSYAVVTLHRPSNVDNEEVIVPLVDFLTNEVTHDLNVLWPIHPRTEKQLKHFGIWEKVIGNKKVILLQPLAYREMLRLNIGARIMLTDSGGLQEECCVLGTPCLTLRWNTERPVTLRDNGGASVLVGNNIDRIREEYRHTIRMNRLPSRPELWDGKTAPRCLSEMLKLLEVK
jgi:UDP-N-acetylglucosamine 2-epimerase (non-hydrolysing)